MGFELSAGRRGGRYFCCGKKRTYLTFRPGQSSSSGNRFRNWCKVMDRIAGILTEVGSPTDHMTILAREFRVPTLVDVTGALESLAAGQEITMDADLALIYPELSENYYQTCEQTGALAG